MLTPSFTHVLAIIISPVDLGSLHTVTLSFYFLKPEGRYGPHEVWAHMGWVGHPPH